MDHNFLAICVYTTVATACCQSITHTLAHVLAADCRRSLPMIGGKCRTLPTHRRRSCDLGSTGRQPQTDRLLVQLFLTLILTCPVGLGFGSLHLPPFGRYLPRASGQCLLSSPASSWTSSIMSEKNSKWPIY